MYNSPAEIIKESVSMEDVLNHYGFHPSRYGRIPCPLHNGKDKNFSYKPKHFKCFVCNKSGSVIDFVMELFGVNFVQAVERINSDLQLGLSLDKPSDADLTAIREKQRVRKEAEDRWQEEYRQLAAEHLYWHEISVHFAPKRPETYGSAYIHPLYAEAVKRLEYLEYITDEMIMARR